MSIEIKYFKDRKEWRKKIKLYGTIINFFPTHINASELPTLKQQGNGLKNLKSD